jgi:protein-S-isoprenylcysteine O-methyltransferase Ste14
MSFTRFIAVILSVVVYGGLAILGWGGFGPFLSHPPLIGLMVVLLALTGVSLFAGGNLSRGVREDKENRWVLPVFTVVGFASAYLPAYCDRRELLTFGGNALRWLGVALYGLGGALRIWPVFVLGNRFSGLVAIQPGHTLVTSGPYRRVRNPSYLGLLIMSVGWALAFRSGVGMLLVALYIPPLVARMHAEERLLGSEFGEQYEAYRAHTSRLIPGIY